MRHIIGCDSRGRVHIEREDYLDGTHAGRQTRAGRATNPEHRAGQPADVIEGADLFIGLSRRPGDARPRRWPR